MCARHVRDALVTEDALAQLGQRVEEAVRATGSAELTTHDVGLAILGPLQELDLVAYLRFASVYRAFDSLEDFEAAITELRGRGGTPRRGEDDRNEGCRGEPGRRPRARRDCRSPSRTRRRLIGGPDRASTPGPAGRRRPRPVAGGSACGARNTRQNTVPREQSGTSGRFRPYREAA